MTQASSAQAPGRHAAPVFVARGLTKVYGSGEAAVYALRERDVDIFEGDITSPREDRTGLGDAFRVEVRITLEEIDAATIVPGSALFRRGDGWAALVFEDRRARERAVGLLRRSGFYAPVQNGLCPGDRVIVFPPSTLKDGGLVRNRQAPSP